MPASHDNRSGRAEGKVAVVTGAAGGIGAAVVRRLAVEGAAVLATDVLEDEGRTLACRSGDLVRFVLHDVTSEQDWNDVVRSAETAFGPVSVLVNTAGIIQWNVPISEMAEADYRRVIDVNQVGVFLGMKATVGSLQRSGRGSIVNVSSTACLIGFPGLVAYVASKWAVRGMTKAAALEFGPLGVRVNSVHPGRTRTPMTEGLPEPVDQPIGRAADPDELAAMVLFLASDESKHCTGAEFVMDGGQTTGKMGRSDPALARGRPPTR